MSEKIILGIDPGTTIMGFGIIKIKDRKMSLIEMNELNLTKYKNHEKKTLGRGVIFGGRGGGGCVFFIFFYI